jgi:hypothetical protein
MPQWAFAVAWIGGPFVIGLAATALIRVHWPRNGPWMAVAGLVLAIGFVVLAYYQSPPSSAPYNGCSDCGNYLGHFWEPQFTVFLAVIGYGLWLLGVRAAIGATAILDAARRALRRRAT